MQENSTTIFGIRLPRDAEIFHADKNADTCIKVYKALEFQCLGAEELNRCLE